MGTDSSSRSSVSFAFMPVCFTGMLPATYAQSRGIYTSEDVIRLLLSGADVVQVVSTVYKNQPSYIATMLAELNDWMDKKSYKTLDDFCGKLSRKSLKDPYTYQRAQYVDILMKSEEIFKKYPMV